MTIEMMATVTVQILVMYLFFRVGRDFERRHMKQRIHTLNTYMQKVVDSIRIVPGSVGAQGEEKEEVVQ